MLQGVEAESPREAEEVEHAFAAAIPGHRETVLALVAVESRLLAGPKVDLVGQLIFEDGDRRRRHGPDELDILPVESFLSRHSPVGPGDDPLGAGELEQLPEQQIPPKVKGQAREMRDKPAVVTVDDKPRRPSPSL